MEQEQDKHRDVEKLDHVDSNSDVDSGRNDSAQDEGEQGENKVCNTSESRLVDDD